ncbi:hypothetical protein [Duganella sp. BJB476]|uniref:hypothetical protein n=1 Tax=Duganella sp. BJB476 TaxID=1871176 RepID=UPI0011C1CFBC|nr:hypothetical protein [Duganella sp. BJB476]
MSLHNGRTSVFIDKFSVTFSVPNEGRTWQDAAEALSHLCQQGYVLVPVRGESAYEHYYAAWHAVVEIPGGKSAKCLIQAFPKSSKKGYLRLEWNPAKLPSAQFRVIKDILAACIPRIEEWWYTVKVTRADLTFDLHNTPISRLLTFSASAATIGLRKKENERRLNAYVLGSENSVKRLTIYDKAFERLIRRDREHPQRAKRLFRCCTRVEFRIRKIGNLVEMAGMKNPLSTFSVVAVADAYAYSDNEAWHRFVRRCESVGAQNALSVLADRKRRQLYREILRSFCTPMWFEPNQIWREAQEKIRNLILTN